jgi:hypothetical protein
MHTTSGRLLTFPHKVASMVVEHRQLVLLLLLLPSSHDLCDRLLEKGFLISSNVQVSRFPQNQGLDFDHFRLESGGGLQLSDPCNVANHVQPLPVISILGS